MKYLSTTNDVKPSSRELVSREWTKSIVTYCATKKWFYEADNFLIGVVKYTNVCCELLSDSSLLHPKPIYCVFSKPERGQTTSNCASFCVSLPRPPSKWQRRFESEKVPFRGYLFVSQLNRTRMLSGRGRTRWERELWIHRANALLFIQSSWSSPASKHWGFLFRTHLKRFDHSTVLRHG